MVEKIIEDFCSTFTAGGKLIYVGDTDEKWAYFDEELLTKLGVSIEAHGKMPDVVVHHEKKNWLILIEAVTSHGPVNAKRRGELKTLFKGSNVGRLSSGYKRLHSGTTARRIGKNRDSLT